MNVPGGSRNCQTHTVSVITPRDACPIGVILAARGSQHIPQYGDRTAPIRATPNAGPSTIIRVRIDKGKLAARRARKARGLSALETARLPNRAPSICDVRTREARGRTSRGGSQRRHSSRQRTRELGTPMRTSIRNDTERTVSAAGGSAAKVAVRLTVRPVTLPAGSIGRRCWIASSPRFGSGRSRSQTGWSRRRTRRRSCTTTCRPTI